RLTIACHVEPPKLRQITLTPDADGHVRYEDDFQTSKFLHLAHVTGREDLKWQPGRLQTHGVRGRAARVLLRWKVVSPQPLRHLKVRLDGRANEKHLGATNRLAVSLDGRKELAADTTAGKPTDKNGNVRQPLQLDLSGDARFEGVRVFWVHVEMLNRSGLPTGTSNSVERLSIEADAKRGP
ncbi:MAG: hypothetical protein GXP27_14765, partial [Planctomycetes bacterium]|nr:hypothetical protein [Planctomycetota bacterium]